MVWNDQTVATVKDGNYLIYSDTNHKQVLFVHIHIINKFEDLNH